MTTRKLIWFEWNASTLSHEARCPDCKQLCGVWTREAGMAMGRGPGPFMPHECAVERYKHPCAGDKCLNNPCCEDGLYKEVIGL